MTRDVRSEVRKAAVTLFTRKGVKGTTIGEIAAAAGVARGALYNHWDSKEDLAADLFAAGYAAMAARLRAASGTGAGPQRLRRVIAEAFRIFEEDREGAGFMLVSQHDVLPLLPAGQETPVDAVRAVVAEGIGDGTISFADTEALAHVVIGAIVMNAQSRIYGRQSLPLTTLADVIADAVLNGMANSGAAR